MLNKINNELINQVLEKAENSPRKRAVHCFSKPEDKIQRMINAGLKDTYVRPHKHENPDKLEIFLILKGKAAVLIFDDDGKITDSVILDENNQIVEIPSKKWHSFIILSEKAALYEIIGGPYDPETHKRFAPWAPEEDTEESIIYLQNKINYINKLFY
ncbi:WbuC family cupin fold metalloprotein [Candidatus Woesearchaeota archaeon]|nr:WbuC family cupin fold metalloprotein [Candidatus Woesearchaeota archaeon]